AAMAIAALLIEAGKPVSATLSEAKAALGTAALVWVDADERTAEVDAFLAGLQLHPLTVEDVFETRTTPKIEDFGKYLYVLAHAVRVPASGPADLDQAELDIVIGPNWVFTHHDPSLRAPAVVREETLSLGRTPDAPRIAHLLPDRLVDDAWPGMDGFVDDMVDDARELLGGVLEAHLAMVSNRLNEITKVLTMIATVFLPVSFIAAIYGMNFEHMPELHTRYGYPAAWIAMLAIGAVLVVWFKKRGWLD